MAKQKVDRSSIEPLLHKVIEGATGTEMPLAELLRLCMRIGVALGNADLVNWARQEASGYKDYRKLPDYRKVATEVTGTFNGPFGSGLKNAPIPKLSIDKEHRELLFNAYLTEPAGGYEHIVSASDTKSDLLELPWAADYIAYYQQKEIYQGVVLSYASQRYTRTGLRGILQTIRTRVLDFGLQVSEELGIDPNVQDSIKKQKPDIEEVEPERVQQIFNTTINASSNLSLGNMGSSSQQLVNIEKGDLAGLKRELKKAGLTKELVGELELAFQMDAKSGKKIGKATTGWLDKVSDMAKSGALQLATGVTLELVKTGVAHFLGVKL